MKTSTIGFLTVIALLAVSSFFSLNLYLRQRAAQDKLDIRSFPYIVGSWQGKDMAVTEEEYEILETRNLISREYINPEGESLFLFIIYSETNRAVFHPPEVCLIGSGVSIVAKQREKIDSGRYKFAMNMMDTAQDDYRGISLYCYTAGNLYTDNFYLQQFWFALNQLLGKHKGGATIRVSMPVRENREDALVAAKAFVVQTAEIIDSLR